MSDLDWLRERERAASSTKWNMRRSSTTAATPAQPTGPSYLPYRENGITKYVSASSVPTTTSAVPNLIDIDDDASTMNLHIPRDQLGSDELQRFTATGRPMPQFKVSPWVNLCDGAAPAPSLLPVRYTDESIIPVVVRVATGESDATVNKRGLRGKFGPKDKASAKIYFMPRGEYLKYFAKDEAGTYVGTEPKRDWTAEELDERFGRYRKSWVKS